MKILKIVLLLIFVLGFGLVVAAFTMGFDLDAITDYMTDDEAYGDLVVYDTTESISLIQVDVDTRHVVILKHEGSHIRLRYHPHETKDTWIIGEEDGTLLISQDEKPQWFVWFGKMASREVRTLYIDLPDLGSYDFDIETGTGDVLIEMASQETHGDLRIESGTGNVKLENLSLEKLDVSLGTGNISLVSLNIANDIDASSNTGTVTVETVSAQRVTLDSNTGSIKIEGLIASLLDANCDTGFVRIKSSDINGSVTLQSSTGTITVTTTIATSFDLSSSTGDISVTVSDMSNYRLDLKTDVGTVRVGGIHQGTTHVTTTGSILIKARVSTGNITVGA